MRKVSVQSWKETRRISPMLFGILCSRGFSAKRYFKSSTHTDTHKIHINARRKNNQDMLSLVLIESGKITSEYILQDCQTKN